MKLILPALAVAALCLSSAPYRPTAEAGAYRTAPTLEQTIGSIASAHGVPADILLGIAWAESSFDPLAISDDGQDRGLFQLRARFDRARAARWGDFDPFDPLDSARIAAKVLSADYERFGDWALAIAAYRQGVRGVVRDGADWWYVVRVLEGRCSPMI